MTNRATQFPSRRFHKTTLCAAMATSALLLAGCGAGAGGDSVNSLDVRNTEIGQAESTSRVALSVALPQRMTNLGIPVDVVVTVGGETLTMNESGDAYSLDVDLGLFSDYAVFLAAQRSSDGLLLGSAQANFSTQGEGVMQFAIPSQLFNTDADDDSDGFDNISEIERGSEPRLQTSDFDSDGIPDESDNDDDNDGVVDEYDAFPLDASEVIDTDGDGIGDNRDSDDDNDNIQDVDDNFPLDANESLDLDLDGLGNSVDLDDDGDGTVDLEDPQPSNPNVTGNEDSDGDGVRDLEDAFPYNSSEQSDSDGDGIGNNEDFDDDNNGIADNAENTIAIIPFSTRIPAIDGAYGWSEWSDAGSSDNKGNRFAINHLNIDNTGLLQDGTGSDGWNYSEDGGYWRAKHDGTNLYVLVVVKHEQFFDRFSDSSDMWHDDSAELYIDVGNDKSTSYGSNDFQRLFRYAHNASDNILDGFHAASGMNTFYRSSRAMEMPGQTTAVYEIRVSLSSIGLSPEERFGFDVQYNDDDNGGDRDAKWSWFAPSFQDNSWQNPSLFGTAILAPIIFNTNAD